MERTLMVLKPDAVQRRLIGRMIDRLERKGLKIVALRMLRMDESLARNMYAEHEGRDFYEPLVAFVTAGPVVAMVAAGYDAIAMVRSLIGPTFGPDAPAGTIRGDFGASRRYNLIHASDSPASAEREIALLFRENELLDYDLLDDPWVYAAVDRE
ncbi:MAG: nucleoside-diphosphate kinase [Phycisphaerae bacterium]|nr:nucleoside-diphosphate kinase [Phycisphaerae bacterium]